MSSFIKDILLPISNILVNEAKCERKVVVKCIVNAVQAFLETPKVDDSTEVIKEEKKSKKDGEKKKKCIEKKEDSKCEKVCEYIFVRSPKKGQRCSAHVDKKSEQYCSKHVKKPEDKDENKPDKKINKKPVEKIKTEKTKAMNQLTDALKNFIDNKKTIQIKIERNKYGNYACVDEKLKGLLVDPISLEVFGIQEESGRINELTRDAIEICKEANLLYKIPLNLSNFDENKKETKEDEKDDFLEDQDCECYEEDMSDMSDIEG